MLKLIKITIIFLLLLSIFYFNESPARAASLINDPSPSSELNAQSECIASGDCEINDFVRVVINVSNIILGLVGSLALLAFIAGGLMWLLSAGNPEWVKRGKQSITGAVVGLAIVFTSYMIIQLVFTSLGIEKAAGGAWSVSSWFK